MTLNDTVTAVVPDARRRRRVRKPAVASRLQRVLSTPIVAIVVIANVAMLAWLLMSAFKESRDILNQPWALPTQLHWENFALAWSTGNFGVATFNSVVLTLGTAFFTILFAAPAAYALSRFSNRAANPLTSLFAICVGIPAQAIFLPMFAMLAPIGLVNNLFGLLIIYVGTSLPFAVFFLTGFFRTLPVELEEAAALDGATPALTFWRVMLPLARPGLITLVILNVIGHWGETFFALVFLQSQELQTLPLALLGYLQQMQYNGMNWGGMFAGIAVTVLPILVLYLWVGRRIIEGMTLGATK
ncbi:carbohydrate ABC transporter permease [Microbacterium sp. CFBP 13617]|uniref:carbohydrate ABC transporter permease n=1 Tax=Microbacterium sp. CFBP 13617 TaxID=2774035 RepID=UPI00177CD5B6|nr:carbohydrate ABC transporter permease [Microbacterium sp. CFBP 13617]MBD8217718.1 carbohydrate ABC transporter permease [Microbacterium sp. CFBP 13617]